MNIRDFLNTSYARALKYCVLIFKSNFLFYKFQKIHYKISKFSIIATVLDFLDLQVYRAILSRKFETYQSLLIPDPGWHVFWAVRVIPMHYEHRLPRGASGNSGTNIFSLQNKVILVSYRPREDVLVFLRDFEPVPQSLQSMTQREDFMVKLKGSEIWVSFKKFQKCYLCITLFQTIIRIYRNLSINFFKSLRFLGTLALFSISNLLN